MSAVSHAGGVVYRRRGAHPEFLVVTARSNPEDWVLPKGHIEDGETPDEAAIREVEEETGVRARIDGPLGDSELVFRGKRQRVRYFLMQSIEEGRSGEGRQTVWLPGRSALEQLSFEEPRRVLQTAIAALSKGPR